MLYTMKVNKFTGVVHGIKCAGPEPVQFVPIQNQNFYFSFSPEITSINPFNPFRRVSLWFINPRATIRLKSQRTWPTWRLFSNRPTVTCSAGNRSAGAAPNHPDFRRLAYTLNVFTKKLAARPQFNTKMHKYYKVTAQFTKRINYFASIRLQLGEKLPSNICQ